VRVRGRWGNGEVEWEGGVTGRGRKVKVGGEAQGE
jgi:hypothetical protein